MLRVLIVEDEMLVRLGICSLINWESLDMSVVAEAGNGQAAWDIYQKEKPDIILTDIKMPIMNGIELIGKIRENDSRTRIIILSCIDDFEYARKALSFDVTGYILKLTMSQEEMESVLNKAKNDLQKFHRNSGNYSRDNVGYYAPQDNLVDTIIYGNYSDDEIELKLRDMNLGLEPHNLIVCVMEIDRPLQSEDNSSYVFKIICDLLAKYEIRIACFYKKNRVVMIMNSREHSDPDQIRQVISHLRRVIKTYYDSSVTFGISTKSNGFYSLKSLYEQALEAVKSKYFLGIDIEVYYESMDLYDIKSNVTSKLLSLANQIDIETLKKMLDSFISTELLPLSLDDMIERIQRLFLDLGHTTLLQFHSGNITEIVIDYEKQMGNSATLDESIEVLRRYLSKISDIGGRKYFRKQIVSVVKYVQAHYSENISLQHVADMVNLNPNYLSSLFKSEYGVGFVDYLTRCRIEKAKDFLSKTMLRSYEIAEKVGFSDESYFCRTFKKHTGLTPNEFRNQSTVEII